MTTNGYSRVRLRLSRKLRAQANRLAKVRRRLGVHPRLVPHEAAGVAGVAAFRQRRDQVVAEAQQRLLPPRVPVLLGEGFERGSVRQMVYAAKADEVCARLAE